MFTKTAIQAAARLMNREAARSGSEASAKDMKLVACMLNAYADVVGDPKPEAPKITADTPVDYGNDTIREHAEHLVRQNVYYCVSSMVDTVSKAAYNGDIEGIDEEDIRAITVQDDWETPAREWISSADSEEVRDAYAFANIGKGWDELPEDMDNDKAREQLAALLEETEEWQEFCDYCRLEAETREAYEHWIVNHWFADQLASHGEMVTRDFLGLTIWGRCTTGQTIAMDHVILTIARDALIRE